MTSVLVIGLVSFSILAVAAFIWVLAERADLFKKRGSSDSAGEPDEEPTYRYIARDTLLSPAEISFHGVLRMSLEKMTQLLGKQQVPLLLIKVRLADVLQVDKAATAGDRSAQQSAHNKIDRKHVDFLVCHPETTRPLLAIELDDLSHNRRDRRDRDDFVDAAFHTAQLPILHIPAAASYDPAELTRKIAKAMNLPIP